MPVVHPAEVWKESGRYFKIGPELVRFKDRGERDMVLAMTHEEVVAILLRDIVQSYRQLPMMVYHFQTKFRDEPRSRGGLIRVREFVMKDAYSCDRDEAGLDKSYRDQYEAYERTFKRLGLDAIAVGADVGIMGGSGAHEFMVLNDFGEDTLVLCDSCGYAENQQIAEVRKPDPEPEDALPMEDVETPGATTIDALATFLGVPAQPDGQGRVLRRRRRPLHRRDRPRRLRRQRDEARERGQGDRRAPAGHGRGDHRPRDAGRLRLADRGDRLGRRRRRARHALAEPRRRGEPRRLAREERQRPPRLHARRRRRDHRGPRGRHVHPLRVAGEAAQGDRGRQHLQARDRLHRCVRLHVPRRGRRAAPDRHGLVRDRRRPEPRLRRRGPSRREGHRLARGGRAVRRPPRRDRGDRRSRASRRSPTRSTTSPRAPATGATSSTTTATSRPA